jgi:hypothetical protein
MSIRFVFYKKNEVILDIFLSIYIILKKMSDTEPIIVRHRVYYDGFEDNRCEYMQDVSSEVLSFVLYQGNWVLIHERDWCTSTDIPGMVKRFNELTGENVRMIIYSFDRNTPEVLAAEAFARGADSSRFPIVDLKPPA